MIAQQPQLIEPITNDFQVHEIYELRNRETRSIEFETEDLSIDTIVTFDIDVIFEEGGCREEILRTITGINLKMEITGTWNKEGDRVNIDESKKDKLKYRLYDNLISDIKDQYYNINIDIKN